MEIDASKRLVYRGEKEVNITFSGGVDTAGADTEKKQ